MKAKQVDQALRKKFVEEGRRLVFWNDEEKGFRGYILSGLPDDLADVTVLDLEEMGGLSAKLLLEREDVEGQYLIYRAGKVLSPEDDWLLDIRHYSAEFYADVASVWIEELGLSGLYLREHLNARSAFLNNQERRKKLAGLVVGDDDAAAMDLKMMAVLTDSQVAAFSLILRALCHGHLTVGGEFELGEEPVAVELFEKMGLADGFWKLVSRDFGYLVERPTIAGLLRHLFVSEFLHQAAGPRIEAIAQFDLPPKGRQNAEVFLAQWRGSSVEAASYAAAAKAVARELKLSDHLDVQSPESWVDVFTFWEVERPFVKALKNRVLDESETMNVEDVRALATKRRAGHWLSGAGRDQPERRAVADSYDAIVSAAELFALARQHRQGLAFESPEALLLAYQTELYRFDLLYRQFHSRTRASTGQGWGLLKSLSSAVERVYAEGFLAPLGLEWSRLLKEKDFLAVWKVPGLGGQQGFYKRFIQPYLEKDERRRAFVIISDAFRYEAARELTDELKGRFRFDAELDAMLGVLPSYTALGMASLLPHEKLGFNDSAGVLIDGKSVSSTEARAKHLAAFGGTACLASSLVEMKRDDARALIQEQRVVYIYHNVVDACGEDPSTEKKTFAAVDECIAELEEVVQYCVNQLNADRIWVTADHGFLFQQEALDETDKSPLSYKPDNTIKAKKRYLMGRNLGDSPEAHHGTTQVTAGTEDSMEYWLPHGANRFHFSGGARFVHGGAMPQEVVIPVVTVKHLRGKQAEQSKVEKVSVQVLGTKHKITASKYRFEIIQLEAVSKRRLPATLRVAVYDGAVPVTSVETVIFDSTSEKADERKKSVLLKLSNWEYDKTKRYRLVLRDADTDAEVQDAPVQIDRTFDDDF